MFRTVTGILLPGFDLDHERYCGFASAYEMPSKSDYSRQSYGIIVMSIFQDGGHDIGNLFSDLDLVTSFI